MVVSCTESQTPVQPSQVYLFHLCAGLLTPEKVMKAESYPISQSNCSGRSQTASARLSTTSTWRRILALVLSPSVEDPKLGVLEISDSFRFNLVLVGDQVGTTVTVSKSAFA
jgi:hypothetical protein